MGVQDVAVQTENSVFGTRTAQMPFDATEQIGIRHLDSEAIGPATKAWIKPEMTDASKAHPPLETDLGLDILDLTSILRFSQAISSELDIDKLLMKMMEIITSSAGSTAELVHMVTQSENEWCIAASGNSEGIFAPMLPVKDIENDSQKQIILYAPRFRATVIVHKVEDDDRFLNSGLPRSVLCLPVIQGKETLGVLYLVSIC